MKTFVQLQRELTTASRVRRRWFGIAQDLCQFVVGNENEGQVHELILRALEHREEFRDVVSALSQLKSRIGNFERISDSVWHQEVCHAEVVYRATHEARTS